MLDAVWSPATTPPLLERSAVHIWRAHLDCAPAALARLAEWLTGEERDHAARFVAAQGRARAVASRGLLRWLLGSYLQRDPAALRFVAGAYGKPALDDGALHFNVTHADHLALYAVAPAPVGIDLERVPEQIAPTVAQRIATPAEYAAWQRIAPAAQPLAFAQRWTMKEAVMKALGTGVSLPPAAIAVTLAPPRLDSLVGEARAARDWALHPFVPAAGFVATLAIQGQGWQVKFWDMPAPSTPSAPSAPSASR